MPISVRAWPRAFTWQPAPEKNKAQKQKAKTAAQNIFMKLLVKPGKALARSIRFFLFPG